MDPAYMRIMTSGPAILRVFTACVKLLPKRYLQQICGEYAPPVCMRIMTSGPASMQHITYRVSMLHICGSDIPADFNIFQLYAADLRIWQGCGWKTSHIFMQYICAIWRVDICFRCAMVRTVALNRSDPRPSATVSMRGINNREQTIQTRKFKANENTNNTLY